MTGRGLLVVALLSTCVLSLPVTLSQLENEDVKVMKCIVEALADVLSRPRPLPVSQECLVILKTDDRLVTILRRHNFLKELQVIAVQGGHEHAELQGKADRVTPTPLTTGDVADRSMLEALGGPGEKSILSQRKRTGNGEGEGGKEGSLEVEESREHGREEKREKDGSAGSHASEAADHWSEGTDEKREEDEGDEEQRARSEERFEDESMIVDKKGAAFDESRAPPSQKSERNVAEEDEPGEKKRSALFPHSRTGKEGEEDEDDEEDKGQAKRGNRESLKRWVERAKVLRAGGKEKRLLGGHSTEVAGEEEAKDKRGAERSPEERELQMMARRTPEERKASEEEGSASRKSEEPEIESLAAIESELESVAQKLHEMRRGRG